MGWWTDYPGADNNFSVRLAELTLRPRQDEAGRPAGQRRHAADRSAALPLPDPVHGGRRHHRFSDEEVAQLRDYLLKGGFLYVDDFWGTTAWEQWADEIARVLPPHEYPIVDIPRDHPIMHTLYDVKDDPAGLRRSASGAATAAASRSAAATATART